MAGEITTDHEHKMQHHAKQQAAATLAAAIIQNRGQKLSLKEIAEVYNDAFFLLHPETSSGQYQAWRKKMESGA